MRERREKSNKLCQRKDKFFPHLQSDFKNPIASVYQA
jgi:hypothetical protein